MRNKKMIRGVFDTRRVISTPPNVDVPERISGTYTLDYNILFIHDIILKKLNNEKVKDLPILKKKKEELSKKIENPQTFLEREISLKELRIIESKIREILSGDNVVYYLQESESIISEYSLYKSKVRTVIFGDDSSYTLDDDIRRRLALIESYFDIAKKYIPIDVLRLDDSPFDSCITCHHSMEKIAMNLDGMKICPNCYTEHTVIMTGKMNKDMGSINLSIDDESIDNFLKAFMRYQGLQIYRPSDILYKELDHYFVSHGGLPGSEIKKLPLNSRGRRGETTHEMLWEALEKIGRSGEYENANLIAREYWGWKLFDVMMYKDKIIIHYIKTQRVFYRIPLEIRERTSSLGTQLRLWRHLQLIGHECYIDEFKIAKNSDSFRNQNRLWKMMCDDADDPEIYYIPD